MKRFTVNVPVEVEVYRDDDDLINIMIDDILYDGLAYDVDEDDMEDFLDDLVCALESKGVHNFDLAMEAWEADDI